MAGIAARSPSSVRAVRCHDGFVDVRVRCVQYLPRSIADFSAMASTSNLSQSVELDSPSPTGSYWVSVYSTNRGNFTLSAQRKSLGTSSSDNQVRVGLLPARGPRGTRSIIVCVFVCRLPWTGVRQAAVVMADFDNRGEHHFRTAVRRVFVCVHGLLLSARGVQWL